MTSATSACWKRTTGPGLLQGDYLPDCLVSNFDPDIVSSIAANSISTRIRRRLGLGRKEKVHISLVDQVDLIIATQSCDLVVDEGYNVTLCRIIPIVAFEEVNPAFKAKGKWAEVGKDRVRGLYLLPSPTHPDNERESLVVDFREIYALPYKYVSRRASKLNQRWQLQSPWREHFSHAFGDFFSRVAKP